MTQRPRETPSRTAQIYGRDGEFMTYIPGIDLGPDHGAVALVNPDDLAATPVVRSWNDAEGALLARQALTRLVAAGAAGRVWYAEQPFVLPGVKAIAGALQYASLDDWRDLAEDHGCRVVRVPVTDWRRDYGIPGHAAARCSRAWVALLWPSLERGQGDHTCDACLLSLRATLGGVRWAHDRLAEGMRRGDERARAVWAAQHAPKRKKRAKAGEDDAPVVPERAPLPEYVEAHLQRLAAAGDVRAVELLAAED